MRVHVVAVGRLRADQPERALFDDYQTRFNRIGRPLALGPLVSVEVEDRRQMGPASEAEALQRATPSDAVTVVLDERGQVMTSPAFAGLLARWRDDGRTDVAFLVGGADGLDSTLRGRADLSLSFGRMVWPHLLARVMLAEQIYRAATILSGSPYHRA